jgi:glycosyltransferase involved in cell wall biosynthesis
MTFEYIQLSFAYAPAWGFGGPIRLMLDYACSMCESGFKATAIVGNLDHNYSAMRIHEELIEGVRVTRVKVYFSSLARRAIYLLSPSMLVAAFCKIRNSPGHVVLHIAEFRGVVPIYAVLLKSVYRKKIILVHSGFGMLHFKKSRLRGFYDQLFLKNFLKSVDLFFAQNTHEFECYREYLETSGLGGAVEKIKLLPLHIDRKYILSNRGKEAKDQLREKYSLPQETFIVVFLGRLHPDKGILRAIDAFLLFAKQINRTTIFLIIGKDYGFRPSIERYILERNALAAIHIFENVYENRFDYYCLADLFIGFPTIYEETMLASVEALACGTPIVVSKEADIPFVQNEGAGYVIEFSGELAAKKMLEISANLERYQKKAIDTVINNFTDSSAIQIFRSSLQECVNQSSARY